MLFLQCTFFCFLFARQENKRKYQRKKRNTQMFLTSSQEYPLRLSRFLQAGKPALFASLVASLDARHCFCRAKLAEHCLRAMPEFARLKRFGVAEQETQPNECILMRMSEHSLGFSFFFVLFLSFCR